MPGQPPERIGPAPSRPAGPRDAQVILVTGASGYVGSRLIPRLLESGRPVRAMVRDAARLVKPPWAGRAQVVQADVLTPESLPAALAGVHAAYYLIHSMRAGEDFHQKDLQAARDFGLAARRAGVERVIYLGALGDPEAALSPHLKSRQATGEALRATGVALTEFRAAVVVGAGSLSFEMVRYLTEHIPLMICPRWVYSRIQPIAIENLLDYLVGALSVPESAGEIIEIGGEEVLTYGEMMTRYAEIRGLRRVLLPVPLLTPRLSSLWVDLVTPISAAIARPLIEGVRNEVVVRNDRARRLFPGVRLLDYASAVRAALAELNPAAAARAWSDAPTRPAGRAAVAWSNGLIVERRSLPAASSPEQLYRAIAALGSERARHSTSSARRLRGSLDRLLGGLGKGQAGHPDAVLQPGDRVFSWAVEAVRPNRLLRLKADMKLPGEAWLELSIRPGSQGGSTLQGSSIYAPKGLLGLAYWYLLYPIHRLVFRGLLHRLAGQAGARRDRRRSSRGRSARHSGHHRTGA